MSRDQYTHIANEYKESKQLPWRTFIERFTLMQMAGVADADEPRGALRGVTAADLACGDGYYSRLLRRAGAEVRGVDASPQMVELARAQETASPLGISYRVSDARDVGRGGDRGAYDLVLAAWLLHYMQSEHELQQLCDAIARVLKPGGRFVTVNTNPDDPPHNFASGRKYGFVKRVDGALKAGAPVIWTLFLENARHIELVNYHMPTDSVNRCLQNAGMENITRPAVQLDPAALRAAENADAEYWRPLLENPPFVFIQCEKAR